MGETRVAAPGYDPEQEVKSCLRDHSSRPHGAEGHPLRQFLYRNCWIKTVLSITLQRRLNSYGYMIQPQKEISLHLLRLVCAIGNRTDFQI